MARTIATIQNQIIANKNADSKLSGLTSPSMSAIWLAWSFICAVAINLFEQLLDVFKTDLESNLPGVALANGAWIQNQVLNVFQYAAPPLPTQVLICDATTGFVPSYAIIDKTKLLVTQCAVVTMPNPAKTVEIKVAAGTPLSPLDGSPGIGGAQATALSNFLTAILPAGTSFSLINDNGDKLYIAGTVYFKGAYNATIQASVFAAINTYLTTLNFNGVITLSGIEQAILAVTGINDVDLTLVQARRDSGSIGQNVIYDLSGGINNLSYQLYAGWIVEETTGGSTWSDTIAFTAN